MVLDMAEILFFSGKPENFVNDLIKIHKSSFLHWLVDTNNPLTPKSSEHGRFTKHAALRKWLEENCQGIVYIEISTIKSAPPDLFFDLEEDAVLFKMTWC